MVSAQPSGLSASSRACAATAGASAPHQPPPRPASSSVRSAYRSAVGRSPSQVCTRHSMDTAITSSSSLPDVRAASYASSKQARASASRPTQRSVLPCPTSSRVSR